jgi:hypothetical protein
MHPTIAAVFVVCVGLVGVRSQGVTSQTKCEKINTSITLTCANRVQWYKNSVLINKNGQVDQTDYTYASSDTRDSLTIKRLNMSDDYAVYRGIFANDSCSYRLRLYGKPFVRKIVW